MKESATSSILQDREDAQKDVQIKKATENQAKESQKDGTQIKSETPLQLPPLGTHIPRGRGISRKWLPPFIMEKEAKLAYTSKLPPQSELSPTQMNRVLRQHRSEISRCQKKVFQKDNTFQGKIEVGFTITLEGKVSQFRTISSSVKNKVLEDCIQDHFQRWVSFPTIKSQAEVEVSYRFSSRTVKRFQNRNPFVIVQ